MSQDKLGREKVVLKECECSGSFSLQRKARCRWGNSTPHFLPPSNFRKKNVLKINIVLTSEFPAIYLAAPCLKQDISIQIS